MKPLVRGQHARDLSVRVNDTIVHFRLDATSQKHDPYRGATIETRGASKKLRFEILSPSASSSVRMVWEDDDDNPLERSLDDIVTELIVSAERQYREACQRGYEWRVERKAQLIEEIQKRKEKVERQERERQIRLEKERVNRLLRDASALRQADEIRGYVEAVRIRSNAESDSQADSELENWAERALAQAKRIDPTHSCSVVESIKDPDEEQEFEDSGPETGAATAFVRNQVKICGGCYVVAIAIRKKEARKAKPLKNMVGAVGLEPTTR